MQLFEQLVALLAQHLICQSARLGITSTLEIGLAIKDQMNHWIKLAEWRAGPNLIFTIHRGRATLDLTSSKLSSGHGAIARLLLQNVSDSKLFKLRGNFRYYPSFTYPTAFPFSKGSLHHFRR